jgi:hypothetical protein
VPPLIKRSRDAPISELMRQSRFGNSFAMPGHPRDRAIAAAMNIARKYKRGGKVGLDRTVRAAQKFAAGGPLDETGLGQAANHPPHLSGMLNSSIPGRTDKLPISVEAGSYVVPSDVLSALGEGNSMAGRKVLDRPAATYLARSAPQPGFTSVSAPMIPIVGAGGEYIVHPDAVRAIGNGDLNVGHNALDGFVKQIRKHNIRTLRNLPGPKAD